MEKERTPVTITPFELSFSPPYWWEPYPLNTVDFDIRERFALQNSATPLLVSARSNLVHHKGSLEGLDEATVAYLACVDNELHQILVDSITAKIGGKKFCRDVGRRVQSWMKERRQQQNCLEALVLPATNSESVNGSQTSLFLPQERTLPDEFQRRWDAHIPTYMNRQRPANTTILHLAFAVTQEQLYRENADIQEKALQDPFQ